MRQGPVPVASWLLVVLLAVACGPSTSDEPPPGPSPSVAGARVYLISPRDGDTVSTPFTVRFGLSGMGVAPAGVPAPNTGHHHLVIDAETPPLDAPLPSDEHHRHFGGGQTEVTLTLPPGRHTLQLVLADHNHVPHVPPLASARIAITVN